MKKIFALAIALVLFGSLFHAPAVHADSPWEITGTDNLEATEGVAFTFPDLEITGSTGVIPVKLLVTHGTLAMSTTTGLTFDGPSTGAEIYFSGDYEDVNDALATLTYTRNSTGADALEVSLVESGEVFFSDNGHLYEYISVPGDIDWVAAEAAAELLSRYGSTGYLTTITSEEENDFVADRLAGAGWMGASDASVEGDWRWVTGPESGDLFWVGVGNGTVVPGEYENWSSGEPNEHGAGEDCGQFLSGGTGLWNDLPCSGTMLQGYVVEFGADGDLPETAGNEFTITTYEAPVIDTISPTDSAVDIDRNENLVITFDQAVNVETGNITIYRVSNDAVLTTINVTSGQVTGDGTDTITINPTVSLPGGTEVYVRIDATAFDATTGGSFAGITSNTAWTFTTERSSSSTIITPITGATMGITDLATSCTGAAPSGMVTISAPGATEYTLAHDALFSSGTWSSLTDGSVTVPWTFQEQNGSVTAYALLRNSSGTRVTLSATASITAPNCPEETIIDEEVVDEEAEQTTELTGPSPWNGEIEPITNVTGMLLIKGEHFDAVYLLENGTRRPFMTSAIYFTWFADFDAVHTVTDATLATIPMGSPALPKPGSLVKIQSKPEVFHVITGSAGPMLEYITSEEAAQERFGADWADLVMDIDVTLFKKFAR
ncbi:Ig-like domain-containing protein [Patescibacteria group bacterium]|nr:Ig-like domain-containing protein [Patescibacteria group bacterium]